MRKRLLTVQKGEEKSDTPESVIPNVNTEKFEPIGKYMEKYILYLTHSLV